MPPDRDWQPILLAAGSRYLSDLSPLIDAADPGGLVTPPSRMLCAALGLLGEVCYGALGGQTHRAEVGRAAALLSLISKIDDQVIDGPAFHGGPGDRGRDPGPLRDRVRAHLLPTLRSMQTGEAAAAEARCQAAAQLGRWLRTLCGHRERHRHLLEVLAEGPIMPLQIRKTVQPQSPAMRYATAVQMVLGDQWLADRAMDGKGLARICRPLLSGHVQRARQTLDEMGLSLDRLSGFEVQQARCEVPGVTGPAEAAAPSAAALGYIFARLADLPECGEALRADQTRQALHLLGEAVGRVIYFIDALEDLKKDFLGGSFNPCLLSVPPHICQDRVALCCQLLAAHLAALPHLLSQLPWQRHRELCSNILCDRLPRRAEKAMAEARRWAGETARAQLVAWKAHPLYQRAPHALLLWLIGLWTWLSFAGGALARKASASRDGGGRSSPCSDCSDAWNNCTKPCSDCSDLCGKCTESCNECNTICNHCSQGAPPCH